MVEEELSTKEFITTSQGEDGYVEVCAENRLSDVRTLVLEDFDDEQLPAEKNNLSFRVKENNQSSIGEDNQSSKGEAPKFDITERNVIDDHFSLLTSSNELRFRNTRIQVYEAGNRQLILNVGESDEEKTNIKDGERSDNDKQKDIVVRTVQSDTIGLRLIRSIYALVAFILAGFLLISCLQLILHLFLNVASGIGLGEKGGQVNMTGLLALLRLPLYLQAMTYIMIFAGAFVQDMWFGSPVLKSMWNNRGTVITDWIVFTAFLGVPLLEGSIRLFLKLEDWWTYTLLTWIGLVFAVFIAFVFSVIYFEVVACLSACAKDNGTHGSLDETKMNLGQLLLSALLCNQIARFSGTTKDHVIVHEENQISTDKNCNEIRTDDDNVHYMQRRSITSLYSHFTQLLSNILPILFTKLEQKEQIRTIHDIFDITPIITSYTWGLEKVYCRDRNAQTVAVVNGPASTRPSQVLSSFIFVPLSFILKVLACGGLLVWFDLGLLFVSVVVILMLACYYPSARNTVAQFSAFKLSKDFIKNKSKESHENNQVTYEGSKTFRITRPTNSFCWLHLTLEVFFLFAFPFGMLIYNQAEVPAILFFLFMGILAGSRFYLNPSVALTEISTNDKLVQVMKQSMLPSSNKESNQSVEGKTRLKLILENITTSPSHRIWMRLFQSIAFVIWMLFSSAGKLSGINESDQPVQLLPDFYYNSTPGMRYPTCDIGDNEHQFSSNFDRPTYIADYIYLSEVAYKYKNITQTHLDDWFGPGKAVDEKDIVENYKNSLPGYTLVSLKFITFSNLSEKVGIVSVRGTSDPWDAITDLQIWSPAILSQWVRAIIPLGSVWTPVLSRIIYLISLIESDDLEDVSYYNQVTEFIKYLQSTENYSSLEVTGHSLGGGIAIISAAKTGIHAVALSGPNAVLSHEAFGITTEDISRLTFNIIPDRDVVPRFDDVSTLFQNIRCLAPKNEFWDCHSSLRSLCEVIYSCGTQSRPALCECSKSLGYEEPKPRGTRTFSDACDNYDPNYIF